MTSVLTNFLGGYTYRTVGGAVAEARQILNDPEGMNPEGNLSGTVATRTLGDLIADIRRSLSDTTPFSVGNDTTFSGTTTSMTISGCLAEARTMLNDTVAMPTYRYTDADLYTYFNQAMLYTRRYRPDLFAASVSSDVPVYGVNPDTGGTDTTPTTPNDMFPIDDTYYPAVTKYVVGNAQLRDDTFTADGKGVALLNAYMETLLRGPYRYTDDFLYSQVDDALLYARRFRPDLFVDPSASAVPRYTAEKDAATLFPVAEYYVPLVKEYVVGQAKLRNQAYTTDEKPAPDAEAIQKDFLTGLAAGPFRYSDAFLYGFATEAMTEARRVRPDLFLGWLRKPLPVFEPTTDADTPFPISDKYYAGYVSYMVGRAMQRDGDVGKDSNSAAYVANYLTQLARG